MRGDQGSQIRERLAACEAVGLHYWGDHPEAGHVWAVDDRQVAHVVGVGINTSAAQHVCQTLSEAEPCAGFTELEEEAVSDDDRLNTR